MEPKDTLKQLRQTTNMSQAKFATKFHIPISTYEQWEMGIRKPPVYIIEMIATILTYERSDTNVM